MFSTLNNVFGVQKPRHAENADTRQEINRQDPDEQKRKDNEQDEEVALFSEDDNAAVSIDALHAFLESFLKSLPPEKGAQQFDPKTTDDQKSASALAVGRDFNQKRPMSGDVAQAMGAYKHAAKGSSGNTENIKRVSVSEAKQAGENLGLQSSEVRDIHKLLEDLKILSDRNIETLVIERSDTFLNGLINAVEKSKLELS